MVMPPAPILDERGDDFGGFLRTRHFLRLNRRSRPAISWEEGEDTLFPFDRNGLQGHVGHVVHRIVSSRATYEYAHLRPRVFELLEAVAGQAIGSGARVLIKPNLLAPARPERAMVTHPVIVRAAAEYALEKGARVQLSDSPAMGSLERVLKESGIGEALNGLGVVCREFRDSVTLDLGEPFHQVEIARDALEADVVVNLPKLKTHSQMLLTLGVKNLFGCIVGFRKPQWHLRAGVDREVFARLLVRIYGAVAPRVTLLDGILAMDGEGPGRSGRPKPVGVVMAGAHGAALDVAVCRMLRVPEDELLTTRIARQEGVLTGEVETAGEIPEVENFQLPSVTPLVFGPPWSHGFLRKHLIQRPQLIADLCRSCGECRRYCPAGAISGSGRALGFDYDRCIRCYCCIEVCPHGALRTHEPLLGRLTMRLMNRRR